MFGSITIHDVKVDATDAAAPFARAKVKLSWTDRAGQRHEVERHASAAQLIITDLARVTEESELARQGYLLGFIRSHEIRREGG